MPHVNQLDKEQLADVSRQINTPPVTKTIDRIARSKERSPLAASKLGHLWEILLVVADDDLDNVFTSAINVLNERGYTLGNPQRILRNIERAVDKQDPLMGRDHGDEQPE